MNDEEAEFIAAVQEGLKALEEGRVLSHEEVKARSHLGCHNASQD